MLQIYDNEFEKRHVKSFLTKNKIKDVFMI